MDPEVNFSTLPESVGGIASLDLNRMASAKDLMSMQDAANETLARRRQAAKLDKFTPRQALTEAGDAVFGVMDDLFGNTRPVPLKTMITKDNRLRGLGVVLVILALAIFVFQ